MLDLAVSAKQIYFSMHKRPFYDASAVVWMLLDSFSFVSKIDVIELGGSDELSGKGEELRLV